MKFPQLLKILALVLVITAGAFTKSTFAQAQGPQTNENVLVNSLVIPMDNTNQGPAATGAFNLRAYGLANRLLQNNIPIKWAIKFNKATKDDTDFSAAVTRVAGNDGVSSGTVNFSGGPFIVAPEYATAALAQVTAFNNLVGGTTDDVTVYQVTTQSTADIRYTLTHKPQIAVGPDGGNLGTGVDQAVFDEAGISNYTAVPDDLVNSNSCFTLAVQAHSTSSTFVNNYRNFVTNGGNLLLQCASINTFENNGSFPGGPGHFQVTGNYTVFGTNTGDDVSGTPIYPNAFMPFNQFVGDLNGDQTGAITDYFTALVNFRNGNMIAAQHNNASGSNRTAYIATVSDLTLTDGGHVFELGGHNYNLNGGNSNLGNINGKRMILNTIFVPVTRPCSSLQIPSIEGWKSVALTGDVNGNGFLDPGDTVTWTVTYINRGQAAATNFQITDVLPASPAPGFTITATGAQTVVAAGTGGGTTAVVKNSSYTGVGSGTTINLLQGGASSILDAGGRVTITIPTKLSAAAPSGVWQNQTLATGANVGGGGVLSDNFDSTHPVIYGGFGGNVTAPGSINQPITPSIDPTVVSTFRATAAHSSISGRVLTSTGLSINRALITVVNAATGETRMGVTNPFGYFTVSDLEVGNVYVVSVQARQYTFADPSHSFMLSDDVAGLTFVADGPTKVGSPVKGPAPINAPVRAFKGKALL